MIIMPENTRSPASELELDLHAASLRGGGMLDETAEHLIAMGWRKAPDPGPIPDGVVLLRKRRVEVHAMRWTGENAAQLAKWVDVRNGLPGFYVQDAVTTPDGKTATAALWVEANSAWLGIETGEWVLRDPHGFYPCKADLIEGPDATYDIVGGVA